MKFDVNIERVSQAVLDCPKVCADAREQAGPLIDAAIRNINSFYEVQQVLAGEMKIIAVERPWHVWVDKHTLLVGVNDVEWQDKDGFGMCEWKTRRAPKLKKDGTPYLGDDENGWLEEISNGPQLAIYAASRPNSRIMVRACVKSTPPVFWPRTWEKGCFSFPEAYIWRTQAGLISAAAQIRAARSGPQPFKLTGIQCTNMYRRVCEFKQVCDTFAFPLEKGEIFDRNNPAWAAIEHLMSYNPDVLLDPELVVLSASSYQDFQQCIQKFHLVSGSFYPKTSAPELEIGTVYHAAMADIYTQLKELTQ